MTRPHRILTTACTLAILLSLFAGCGSAEPAPTACPLPPLPTSIPPSTSSEGGTVLTGSVDPRCSGGDLSPAEAADLMADTTTAVALIDTRTPAEYQSGHIPGAANLSTQEASFWDDVGALPVDGVYILYCRTGSTTRRVVEQMLAMGFGSVCHIESGFNGWERAGFPVTQGEA